jgi:hypothetical protein
MSTYNGPSDSVYKYKDIVLSGFASVPTVLLAYINNSPSGAGSISVGVTNVTKDGFRILFFFNISAGNLGVSWCAIDW